MKKIVFALMAVLAFQFSFGQEHTINWRTEVWQADSVKQTVLAFDNALYNDGFLPSLLVDLPLGVEGQLINPIYEPCSDVELTQLIAFYPEQIAETPLVQTFIRTKDKEQVSSMLIFPFVVENGVYRKLVGYNIQQTVVDISSMQSLPQSDRYAASSVLNSGRWIKIGITESGIYKLTYEQLQQMGITPANVRVFGYGGALLAERFTEPYIDDLPEVAIYMNKGSDGVFGAGDYILFYAQGRVSWRYTRPSNTPSNMFVHTQNHYAKEGYYFVTSDAGTGKKIAQQGEYLVAPDSILRSYTDYLVYENDSISLIESGREFYGETFSSSSKMNRQFSFNIPNVLNDTAMLRIDGIGKADAVSYLQATVNAQSVGQLTIPTSLNSPIYEYAKTGSIGIPFKAQATNRISVGLTYTQQTGHAWLNFFELNLTRALTLQTGSPLFFRNPNFIGKNKTHQFRIGGASSSVVVWDVTDQLNVEQMTTTALTSDTLAFNASTTSLRQYVALDLAGSFPSPRIVGTVANQNLHAISQQDMVIITHSDFMAQANRLAQIHRYYDDFTVSVVSADLIYNEFSSGTPDATAYRRFMKMFYDRATNESQKPKYLLLFGDGSYDNRGLHSNVPEAQRRLLTFQSYNSVSQTSSYTSDDYFGFLDDSEGNMSPVDKLDIGVGRLPVYSAEQATTVVDKTEKYIEDAIKGKWKNQILYMADDGDANEHISSADSVARLTAIANPDLLVRKLYFDAYKQETSAVGERYPQVKKLFDDYIKSGVLLINYMGHGGYSGWSNEAILTLADITSMYNDRYPVFVTATCDFTGFDANMDTGGELLLWNKNGGAATLFTTTRTVYASPNFRLNCYLTNAILEKDSTGAPLRFGDVMRNAKNRQADSSNKFAFALIGDPALRLVYPYKYKVLTDSIDRRAVSTSMGDTVSALAEVTICGSIADLDSVTVGGFSGTVSVMVFDKEESITTLCNDCSTVYDVPFTYKDRPNPIFNGSAAVVDGRFSITFMVPKDIRYSFGTGRIVYYASDATTKDEANGSYTSFIVGGEADNIPFDDKGPDAAIYLNTARFQSGDIVNESPVFFAEVYDESGINTVGSGIGHDIILRTNDNPTSDIVLNNYYTSHLGSYKSGSVRYQLSSLADGNYTLLFRVWDLQNNSATRSLDFKVQKGYQPDVEDLSAYPNPATDAVTFVYTHDRPNSQLSITISVFDLTGRQIWQSQSTPIATDNQTAITWNFKSEGLLGLNGLYLARMKVSADNGDPTYKTIKLIIRQ